MSSPEPAASPSPEQAVRAYLQFLSDPGSLRDEAALTRLRGELEAASDPIEKLRLLTAIEQAEVVDAEGVKLGFLLQAKHWADQQGVSASAFRALGVPDEVLVAAGFGIGGAPARRARAGGGGRRRASSGGSERRGRAAAVPQGEIASVALGLDGPFTLAELVERTGSSPATVKKAVDALVTDGKLEAIGPDPEHRGRGRAPGRFRSAG